MAARLVINSEPEVLIKDIMEGYLKGNHTLEEAMDLMETVGENIKMEAK